MANTASIGKSVLLVTVTRVFPPAPGTHWISWRGSKNASVDNTSMIRCRRFPWLELIWADGGYNAWQVDAAVAKVPRLHLEIVKRSDDIKGFVVLPRRWVVERTFSWFGRNRRLAKDFENLAETLTTFVTLASIQLALRRLARA